MPQAPTANMGLVRPTDKGDTDAWDALIDTMFAAIDGHTHAPGLGVVIPSAGLGIDGDVPWATHAITGLKAIDFTPSAAAGMTGYASAFYVDSADNELYFRTQAGVAIKFTNAGTINISIVGGIGGDYSSVGALLSYDDATDSYWLRQQAVAGVRGWARIRSGDLDLYETSGVAIANRVRHQSPAGLAASYALTWLAALPGATTPLQVSSAGAITASFTFGSLITASAGLTAAAGQNLTVSGAGELKHGDRVLELSAMTSVITAGWSWSSGLLASASYMVASGAGTLYVQIPLKQGDRIKSITWARWGDGVASFTANTGVVLQTAAGAVSNLGSGGVVTPPAAWNDTTQALTNTTLAAGDSVFAVFTAGAANLRVANIRVTYDRP